MNYMAAPGLNKKSMLLYLYGNKKIIGDRIISIVCSKYGVTFDKLISKCRKREYVEPRQVIMYFLCIKTSYELKQIGELFGGMHYSTIIYSRDLVKDMISINNNFKNKIQKIDNLI